MYHHITITKTGLIAFIFIFLTAWNAFAQDKYFPLSKDASWTYKITIDGKTNNETLKMKILPEKYLLGEKLIPRQIEKSDKTKLEFFVEGDEGFYVYAEQDYGMAQPEMREKPYYYIRKPYRVGTTWDDDYTTKHLMEPVKFPIKVTIQSMDETITVPAGTFEKCLKLKKSGQIDESHGGYFGKSKVIVEENFWYAPGVGLVKSEFNEMSNHRMSGPGHGTMLLESYKNNSKKKSAFFWK